MREKKTVGEDPGACPVLPGAAAEGEDICGQPAAGVISGFAGCMITLRFAGILKKSLDVIFYSF